MLELREPDEQSGRAAWDIKAISGPEQLTWLLCEKVFLIYASSKKYR